MKTQVLSADDPDARKLAVELLRAGQIVALPTETVYGLAADALNVDAALKVFEAKERPKFDPLIVHLPSRDWLPRLTTACCALDQKLIDAFWPGPLTLVLPRQVIVPDVVTAGSQTVAIRMSAHPVFREVCSDFGTPLAAPSANRFGRISPTAADHVLAELDGRVPLILDAGPTTHGVESTIVVVRNGEIGILRPGPITEEQLREFGPVRRVELAERPEAPGQLPTHYAPRTPLVLTRDAKSYRTEGKKVGVLELPSDLRQAAAVLFQRLRELDTSNCDVIVAEEIPEEGLGHAIMDRLRRAAAR